MTGASESELRSLDNLRHPRLHVAQADSALASAPPARRFLSAPYLQPCPREYWDSTRTPVNRQPSAYRMALPPTPARSSPWARPDDGVLLHSGNLLGRMPCAPPRTTLLRSPQHG